MPTEVYIVDEGGPDQAPTYYSVFHYEGGYNFDATFATAAKQGVFTADFRDPETNDPGAKRSEIAGKSLLSIIGEDTTLNIMGTIISYSDYNAILNTSATTVFTGINGDTFNSLAATIGGIALAGSEVVLFDGDNEISNTIADAVTGNFSVSASLAQGEHNLVAKVKDATGNFIIELNTLNTQIGTNDADSLVGGVEDDVLASGAGNDRLYGGVGVDVMHGGLGDDTYVVDNKADKVIELSKQGTDVVKSSVSFGLGGQYIENLTLTGTGNLSATGNSLANVLRGNAGANVLDGKAGADTMVGGVSSDTYIVDNTGDKAIELSTSAGTDLVKASVSYSLAGFYVENLTLTGAGNLSATGNTLVNVLKGNTGANHLDGGLGADTLTGLAGNDSFVFSTKFGTTNIDHITDFSAMDDTIQLSKSVFAALSVGPLASTAFKDLGVTGAKIDANDRVLYDHKTGAVSYDADGSGTAAKAIQFAVIDNHATTTLTHLDFLVA
ncbi:calcium-binding protein [Methylobacterium sp. WCS2018Hpa-22]|uniref:calcium-binding protein n=1 Tax=Methylobacterium sp. WCS2018Hpa-22 TaxID=3073633 RepID=UPI00288A139C|nr:calcium-binding protein [Methylobacterium sp. WCS2018Hpa-22]